MSTHIPFCTLLLGHFKIQLVIGVIQSEPPEALRMGKILMLFCDVFPRWFIT